MEANIMPAFKAAGVLPIQRNQKTGKLQVLLPMENVEGSERCRYFENPKGCRNGDKCEYLHIKGENKSPNETTMARFNLLGGRKHLGELYPADTAARKLFEETSELIPHEEAKLFVSAVDVSMVRLYGCYDLYMGWIDRDLTFEITERYNTKTDRDPVLAWADALHWVPLEALLNVHENGILGFHISYLKEKDDEDDDPTRQQMPAFFPISHLLWSLCVKNKAALQRMIDASIEKQ
jgi:hypothetical protein